MLILAATPIGDADDASPRLRRELADADIIAAEDTRRLRSLLQRLDISTRARVVSYYDANEAHRAVELVAAMREGARVVVVSDAGMPTVSDPGYRVVQAALAAGVAVSAVPGPSAVLTALAVSGLAVDRFCFEGFLPRRSGERARRLAELSAESRTMVFFESPHRVADMLMDAASAFGQGRSAAVCRELTKTYEEVARGTLAELVEWAAQGVRGEVTIVIGGAAEDQADVGAAVAEVEQLVAGGSGTKAAVAEVSAKLGVAKNPLYAAVLAQRRPADNR